VVLVEGVVLGVAGFGDALVFGWDSGPVEAFCVLDIVQLANFTKVISL
jgi:hypothetical protein